MKRTILPCLVAGLVLSSTCLADSSRPFDPSVARPPRSGQDGQQQCRLLGYVFYRLGEQRDAGAGVQSADGNVERWLGEWQGTGTHLKLNYHDLVASADAFVFKQAALTPSSLGYFAYNSCQIDAQFANDEPRRSASTVLLMKSVAACQSKFPKPLTNTEVGDCVRRERTGTEQRVK